MALLHLLSASCFILRAFVAAHSRRVPLFSCPHQRHLSPESCPTYTLCFFVFLLFITLFLSPRLPPRHRQSGESAAADRPPHYNIDAIILARGPGSSSPTTNNLHLHLLLLVRPPAENSLLSGTSTYLVSYFSSALQLA